MVKAVKISKGILEIKNRYSTSFGGAFTIQWIDVALMGLRGQNRGSIKSWVANNTHCWVAYNFVSFGMHMCTLPESLPSMGTISLRVPVALSVWHTTHKRHASHWLLLVMGTTYLFAARCTPHTLWQCICKWHCIDLPMSHSSRSNIMEVSWVTRTKIRATAGHVSKINFPSRWHSRI